MRSKYERQDELAGILFLTPYLILWLLFAVLPVGYGFYISIHKWNPMGDSPFVGFDNYIRLFQNDRFWNALENTVVYALWAIPLTLVLGLAFALLLKNARIWGLSAVEGALFFPYLLNVAVVGILWTFLLDPSVGIVPYYLKVIGITPPTFLNSPTFVLPTIAFVSAWWLCGYRMVVFRAALNAIPSELYESSELDGAGRVQQFFMITLPLIKPSLLFATIVTLVAGLCMLAQVIIMTDGGPGTASEVLALFMYRTAFESFDFGSAAAVGFILFAIVLVVSLGLVKLLGLESELG